VFIHGTFVVRSQTVRSFAVPNHQSGKQSSYVTVNGETSVMKRQVTQSVGGEV
jgi:hypothetical protein